MLLPLGVFSALQQLHLHVIRKAARSGLSLDSIEENDPQILLGANATISTLG